MADPITLGMRATTRRAGGGNSSNNNNAPFGRSLGSISARTSRSGSVVTKPLLLDTKGDPYRLVDLKTEISQQSGGVSEFAHQASVDRLVFRYENRHIHQPAGGKQKYQVVIPSDAKPSFPARPECIEGIRWDALAEEPLSFWGVWFILAAVVKFKRPIRRRKAIMNQISRDKQIQELKEKAESLGRIAFDKNPETRAKRTLKSVVHNSQTALRQHQSAQDQKRGFHPRKPQVAPHRCIAPPKVDRSKVSPRADLATVRKIEKGTLQSNSAQTLARSTLHSAKTNRGEGVCDAHKLRLADYLSLPAPPPQTHSARYPAIPGAEAPLAITPSNSAETPPDHGGKAKQLVRTSSAVTQPRQVSPNPHSGFSKLGSMRKQAQTNVPVMTPEHISGSGAPSETTLFSPPGAPFSPVALGENTVTSQENALVFSPSGSPVSASIVIKSPKAQSRRRGMVTSEENLNESQRIRDVSPTHLHDDPLISDHVPHLATTFQAGAASYPPRPPNDSSKQVALNTQPGGSYPVQRKSKARTRRSAFKTYNEFLWSERVQRNQYHEGVCDRLDQAQKRREHMLPLKRWFILDQLDKTGPGMSRTSSQGTTASTGNSTSRTSVKELFHSVQRFVDDQRMLEALTDLSEGREKWFFEFYTRVTDFTHSEIVGQVLEKVQRDFLDSVNDRLTPGCYKDIFDAVSDDDLLEEDAQFVLFHAAVAYGVSIVDFRELLELRHVHYRLTKLVK